MSQRAGQHEQDARDETAAPTVEQPAGVDRELLRLGPGQEHAVAQRVQEPPLADPAPLVDQRALHDRDLARRAAEGLQRDQEPRPGSLSGGRPRCIDAISRPLRGHRATGWQDATHAWNQPHPGRGRHPRRPPGRHVVLHRPGPHDAVTTTFGSTTTIEFTCTAARRARPSPTWSARRCTRSRSTASRSTPAAYADSRIALTGLAGRQRRWSCAPTAPTRAPARACTGSSTPPTTASTCTPSSRCPTPAACYTTFEQPDLKAPFTFTRHRALALEGRLQRRRRPSPRAAAAERQGRSGTSSRPSRCRPTSPRWSPASTTWCSYTYAGKHGDIPLGLFCRQSLVEHLDADEHHRGHQAGLRVLRGRLRLPLPVRQVRPAVRAGVQHGRDGERRLRDVPRRVPPPQPPGPRRSTSSAPR